MAAPPAPRRRSGRWRAVVLLAVHLLVALHVVHWLREGETLSPVEPSEAMALSARGVVNAGAVFFALTLASTAALEEGVARERALARVSLLADPEQDLRLAWLCLLLGDDATCEEAIRRALVALPDAAPLRVDWADLLVARGRLDEALVVLDEAARLEGASGAASGARARLARLSKAAGLAALEAGDRAAAEAHLERDVLAGRDVESLVALAFLLDKRGERERAATLLAEARALEGAPR